MFDFKFNWDKTIEIGIKELDEQHKELFRIGRAMEQMLLKQCMGASNHELLGLVCELREYITYHFYYEETIMEEINYLDFETHKREHNSFRKLINSINCMELCNSPYTELAKLREIVQTLVFEHILMGDKQFGLVVQSMEMQV